MLETISKQVTLAHPIKTKKSPEPRKKFLTRGRRKKPPLSIVMLTLGVIIISIYIMKMFIPPQMKVQAAVLINADTGNVLYSYNADQALPPASMSKMMTELLVLEAVASKQHTWDENVTISRYAAEVPGSQIGMNEGEHYSLKQLFDSLIIHSANDAAVAIAEHISGSETEFVQLMNAKAKNIGLSAKTVYANASGLTSGDLLEFPEAASFSDTMMTARDAAKLTRWLLQNYPDVLKVSSQKNISIPQRQISYHTTNLMLPGETHAYRGNDGFKTGYTYEAGYCFTGTAERGGSRLISVVMGASDSDERFTETRKLMDYGFRRHSELWDTLTSFLG
ncbi:D-alanyl-D-alanine carboxypeptidase family protein [Paenibacillus sp. GCM10028914]|uniref:D-alanyl-D-alanine carboxypeptidase family protein n=1 Tax=Paenibacillus sp. GCM10028914 TaxID=3273416 RepID=UPI003614990F